MAIMDHMDGDEERKSGDLWQLEGPLTYKPTPYAVCQFYANSGTVIGLKLFFQGYLLIKTPVDHLCNLSAGNSTEGEATYYKIWTSTTTQGKGGLN